ncbi:hypothetical protein E8E13_001247 [Curvularia kusanoi]|uniref:Heterokaryon incompatibility domain-containing protein n=1 Tax=Curvularia kusanoi TaxID=90978 RepID=A0A9P4T4G2_CURKU|nr:hypothetical protein E8E13_001247 [Curvularia kusanoi]
MRVLCVDTFKFKEFHSLPDKPYAILSHVWGPTEEITYEDMTRPFQSEPFLIEGKDQASAKLRGCREQARKDDIEYFWIDTCCINKPNYTELSEAINSMFYWYQKSKVCYAYLVDAGGEDEISKSKWFSRGWTLQELVAPERVVLFDKAWNIIGSKKDLSATIETITKIPQDFLLGRDLDEASVAQRMSWASRRETSKEEDLAYCLFGIFGVHMPLLYGERLTAAFRRLQLEILHDRADTSIFAWMIDELSSPFDQSHVFGLLALSPAAFEGSHDIVNARFPGQIEGFLKGIRTPILSNNRGLHLSLPVVTRRDDRAVRTKKVQEDVDCTTANKSRRRTSIREDDRTVVAALDCTKENEPNRRLTVQLKDISANDGRFARYGSLTSMSTAELVDEASFVDITTEVRLFRRFFIVKKHEARAKMPSDSVGRKKNHYSSDRRKNNYSSDDEDDDPWGAVHRRITALADVSSNEAKRQ